MSAVYVRGVFNLTDTAWSGTAKLVALVGSTYTPNVDHTTDANLTNELTDPSYSRQALANPVTVEDAANDRVRYDADDTVFANLAGAITPAFAVILRTTGVNLVSYSTLTTPPAPNGGNYTIQWGANGCFTFDVVP